MKITIVVDPAFGEAPCGDLGDAYWLVESPANRELAESLRETGKYEPNSAVFKGDHDNSPLDATVAMLETVILHHPDWTVLSIVGVGLDDAARSAFRDMHMTLGATPRGFIATPI